jgi:hypothetical protein
MNHLLLLLIQNTLQWYSEQVSVKQCY